MAILFAHIFKQSLDTNYWVTIRHLWLWIQPSTQYSLLTSSHGLVETHFQRSELGTLLLPALYPFLLSLPTVRALPPSELPRRSSAQQAFSLALAPVVIISPMYLFVGVGDTHLWWDCSSHQCQYASPAFLWLQVVGMEPRMRSQPQSKVFL